MGSRHLSATWAIALLLVLTARSWALTVELQSLDQAIAESDVVLYVIIKDSTKEWSQGVQCGTRYTATALYNLKGAIPTGSEVTFGRRPDLDVGKEYLVFLHRVSAEEIYEKLPPEARKNEPRDWVLQLVRCNGLVPGLQYDPYFFWELDDGAATITGILSSSWPPGIRIYTSPNNDHVWTVSQHDLFSYIEHHH